MAIDRVHEDGDLRAVHVTGFLGSETECGYLDPGGGVIGLNARRNDHELTIAHETGHLIAFYGLGDGKPICGQKPELAAWRAAARASAPHRHLSRIQKTGVLQVEIAGKHTEHALGDVALQHVGYLLLWEELWARSYSQFVAQRCGDAAMLGQLREELTSLEGRALATQWDASEFGPIEAAIVDVFTSRGWI